MSTTSGNRPEVAIRAATVDDCPVIAAMEHEEHGFEVADRTERCHRHVEDPEICLLVAEVGGAVVGFGRAARFDRPAGAPTDTAPAGWYLFGVIVRDAWRRHGIGSRLTDARLDWITDRDTAAWYVTNARNAASIAMHQRLGFVEVTRECSFPGSTFQPGAGVLCRMTLPREETIS
jgi:ribosomal protein S18 acetylase RimI-like enzyme